MNDEKLAQRLKRHDENALAEIITGYTAYVSTIAYNISDGSLTKSDIEEVVTDVFVTLWNNADKLKTDKLKAYISCITKSRTKDKLRKLSPAEITDISELHDLSDADMPVSENYENRELYESLKEEVRKIKEPDKEILIRYYYYYQNTSEIAKALSINLSTIKAKLQRTREKLKKALIERGY